MSDYAATSQIKKKMKMPHVYILLVIMILVAAVLTWLLPAGQFEREGRMVKPGTYHLVEKVPLTWNELVYPFIINPEIEGASETDVHRVGPLRAVKAVFDGLVSGADIIMFIYISFAAVTVLIATGCFHGFVAWLARTLQGKVRAIIIPIFLIVFGFAAATIGMFEETLPFIPIFAGIGIAMGYDAVLGCGMVALGVGIGYAGAFMNPFTVGVAQQIAGLAPLSGAWYRIICHVVQIAVASVYMIRYGMKIQADPTKSVVYGEDFSHLDMDEKSLSKYEFGPKQKWSLVVFLLTLVVFVFGVKYFGWYFSEIATVFLLMSMVVSLIMGWTPNQYVDKIVFGLKDITVACLMVGIARGIQIVLNEGGIIDTVVYGMSIPLGALPSWLAAECMLVFQTLLNFLIPSGSGQAMAVMPIMAPLADAIGLSKQVAVLAYQMGDGLSNILWPTAFAVVMAGLGGFKVTSWWKWLVPLFLWLLLTQGVLVAIAVMIGF